jgi:hypothetical protein
VSAVLDNDLFHLRSRAYTGGFVPTTPVGVTSGLTTAHTIAGQIAILSAVNLLARSHPHLVIAVPDAPLLVNLPLGASTLREACSRLAAAVDPSLIVETMDVIPEGMDSMGIGIDAPKASVFVGGLRWTALVAEEPVAITDDSSSVLGACMAVVLAHGHLFRRARGWSSTTPWSMSLWSLEQTSEPTGPPELGPVDVGTVWLVGAGAVGSCLAWWLSMIGVVGEWHVIDDDIIKQLNLDRSLAFFHRDVEPGPSAPTYKCDVVAGMLPGAVAHRTRWDDFRDLVLPMPDIIIPVANEDSVRAMVAYLGHPAVIHATTGREWTSELHRHLPGSDGCLSCRLPADMPQFVCADGGLSASSEETQGDAALPFLSAGAGLLLVAGLLQLQYGEWMRHDRNHWRVHFAGPAITSSHWLCSANCQSSPLPAARAHIYGRTRWIDLDREAAGLIPKAGLARGDNGEV